MGAAIEARALMASGQNRAMQPWYSPILASDGTRKQYWFDINNKYFFISFF
ncbi:hypothetical protein LCM19_07210 [Qipengyuania flava]|nr:hypothetical protein [Qipengyuania flava]